MAVITQYVVKHKGVDKLITTDKKEADKYDKMLEVADNLSEYLLAKGIELEEKVMEELSVTIAKNKDGISRLFKGTEAQTLLADEKAEVVELSSQAS